MGLREKGLLVIFMGLIIIRPMTFAQGYSFQADKNFLIDSLLNTMTVDEKIGQLLMLPVYSDKNEQYYNDIEYLISRYHIGGLIFFQGTPARQAELTNRFQKNAKIGIFVAMDAEWGLSMRLDSLTPLPRNMTLGAVQDKRLIYNVGAEIARQCKLMGVHINFAPVLDVNSNPDNPIINIRSFGENPEKVTECGMALMHGLQDNGIIAVGKHFPGHGDTGIDSHYSLPVIKQNINRLDSLELIPFKNAINSGLKGIMVAHLNIPALEPENGLPASLSKNIIRNLLINDLDYINLVITDAMNMRGVTSRFAEGDRELAAFIAGNDLITMPVNIPAVFKVFKSALKEKTIAEQEISERVRKILSFKYDAGLFNELSLPTIALTERLNSEANDLSYSIFENATTLLNNQNDRIPFHLVDTIHFASLSIYEENSTQFKRIIDRYAPFAHYSYLKNELSQNDYDELLKELSRFEVVLVSLHNINNNARRQYGLSQSDIQFINKLNDQTNVVQIVYGNPYSLKYFENCTNLICAYEDNKYAQETVAQQLFGAIPFRGKLPVSASVKLFEGSGIERPAIGRLGYSSPEREKFNVQKLSIIDTIVNNSIKEGMIPGAQLLIARNGRIVMEKNYGYVTDDNRLAVHDTILYDLASITKVAGTVQILMMLTDHGFIDLDKKISYYLEELRDTNKEDLIIRDILAHQAGLIPYYPYWINTMNNNNGENKFYNSNYSIDYNVEITENMYARSELKDSIWHWMIHSDLLEKQDTLKPYEYIYSDIGFYIIQKLIESITGEALNDFLDEYLFTPLCVRHISYLPKKYFPLEQIAPSSVDRTFRKGIVHGNVHDEIASIYGGIAGHAGLFSNAYSLAVIMQMNLQNGYYGGTRYIQPDIIGRFTRRQYTFNRRGLGWDKPQVIGHEYNPASYLASLDSYGHSGFTGTYVWVDPAYNLVYIFLSNRTYPDPGNKKLIDTEVRKRIQTVIYSSLVN
jgi:beta-glucosidase-like glycosyl hydrolase/CubicO group peptidase (beta-lactamase class C family)